MKVGVPKEIKDNEYRVALPPGAVKALSIRGHEVYVQAGAGMGSGFPDEEYQSRGGKILKKAEDVWGEADMVVKVKEPRPEEYQFLREDLLLFTYLHLAAEPELTQELIKRKVPSVAYETVEMADGCLPLLTPMSEVAGRMSIQVGAHYLERANGGSGKLLGGVPGVRPAHVVIIGGGVVGTNAAKMALGLGAQVTVLDINIERLRYLSDVLHGIFFTVASNPVNIADAVRVADLLVGAVLIPGARAPRLVEREMISTMKPGSVIVDVAVDQGGCVETIEPTSHSDPIYFVDDVVHYGVTNMPGAVPRTSTYALSNATLPYAIQLADKGLVETARNDKALALGVNTYQGHVTYKAVAQAFDLECKDLNSLL
jgi:alanine dehydrogenase